MGGSAEHKTAPRQRLQRVSGAARVSLVHLDGSTRLGRLYQEGSAKIRLPRTHNGPAADIVLINTSGGITGGDRLDWTIDVGTDARCVATTQLDFVQKPVTSMSRRFRLLRFLPALGRGAK